MSLFSTLLRLQVRSHNTPTEDYMTELFAYALREYPDIMQGFLKLIDVKKVEDYGYTLRTQYRYRKLKNHDNDSIPDMVLFLSDHTIFIENKVSASENGGQLKKYAEQLNALPTARTLVFITRDYEPKDKEKITKNCTKEINFIQLRWHQVFHLLKPFAEDATIKQILIFMKNQSLSSNNRFSPVDMSAMLNFNRVRGMLDDTMQGVVLAQFKEIMGGASQSGTEDVQYRKYDRYVYFKYKSNKITIHLGYFMNAFNEKDYSDLGIMIEVQKGKPNSNTITDIFRTIVKEGKGKWVDHTIDGPKGHSQIYLTKGLNEFLNAEDHINEVRNYFLDCLKEYQRIEPQLKPYL